MADKYHISPSTGNPNKCSASVKPCPLGGENEHYPSKEAAREAYEKTQTNGGNTVAKLKKATASKVENEQGHASVSTIGGVSITPEMTERYNSSIKKIGYQTPPLSKAEDKVLEDVGNGKKVSDEKLDAMIDRLRWSSTNHGHAEPEQVAAGAEVLSYLKAVRSKSPAPNTLPTATTFDPAKQSLFSNPQARNSPAVMAKSLSRTSGHMEWMQQLATDSRAAASGADPDQRESYLNSAKRYDDEAKRAEAKLHAQFREAQWCFDNNETWRNNAKFGLVRHLRSGMYRDPAPQYRDIPIDGVRKAK